MSDYIKREDAIKAVANNYWHGTECECYAFAHKALDGIKSANVVQVVRCKDCRHWCEMQNLTGACLRLCAIDGALWMGTDATDFCSFAERKDDECMERNDDARRSNEYE